MVPAAKAVLLLGGGSVGCFALYKLSNVIADNKHRTIAFFDDIPTEYKGKFGEDFKHHLVEHREEGEENKRWWEGVFNRWFPPEGQRDGLSEEFKKVSEGFGNEDKHLSKVCRDAYKKGTKTDIFPDTDSDNSKKKYREDIWKYCTWYGRVPEILEKWPDEEDSTKTTWFKHLKDKKLVNTINLRNLPFWASRLRELRESKDSSDTFKSYPGIKHGVISACTKAYGMDKDVTASDNKWVPREQDILKYCSFAGK